MEKNKKILVVLGILIGIIGISLAYFVGKMLSAGQGASVKVTTANIKNSELHIEGELNFNAPDMLPGHKDVSILKVTAKGNNELIPFNIIWEGINELGTALNFTVYKLNTREEVKANCSQKKEKTGGGTMLYETCEITNIDKLGEAIGTGTIASNTEKEITIIAPDQFMTSTPEPGSIMYYYVILEYPNLESDQTLDMGKGFNGVVKVEPSETEPDIQIASVQIEQEDGTYKEQDDIPEGYTIDTKQSTCTNDVTPTWDATNHGLLVNNLTKSGTTCNLVFRNQILSEKTLVVLRQESKGTVTTVTGPSCSTGCTGNMNQNGVYEAEDDFGTSYVFRGTIDNNWVKFGKFKSPNTNYSSDANKDIWWRIIRINGNGTIRLIYSGATAGSATPNPTEITTQLSIGTRAYNNVNNDNTYVGYMNNSSSTSNYNTAHENNQDSDIKKEIDKWWEDTNLADLMGKIDIETGFCNDRSLAPSNHGDYKGPEGGWGTTQTAYAGYHRTYDNGTSWDTTDQEPTLKCANITRDLFTGKEAQGVIVSGQKIEGNKKLTNPVGLITMDEVIYAGGFGGQDNNNYWLYATQGYWTMTPYYFYNNGSNQYAYVFFVGGGGNLAASNVETKSSYGIRPVINLKADVSITGKGTIDDPYIVEGAE